MFRPVRARRRPRSGRRGRWWFIAGSPGWRAAGVAWCGAAARWSERVRVCAGQPAASRGATNLPTRKVTAPPFLQGDSIEVQQDRSPRPPARRGVPTHPTEVLSPCERRGSILAAVVLAAAGLAADPYGDISDLKLPSPKTRWTSRARRRRRARSSSSTARTSTTGSSERRQERRRRGSLLDGRRHAGPATATSSPRRSSTALSSCTSSSACRTCRTPRARAAATAASTSRAATRCRSSTATAWTARTTTAARIYEVAAPLVNACKAPTVWQSYDIDFTAPKCDGRQEDGAGPHHRLSERRQDPRRRRRSPMDNTHGRPRRRPLHAGPDHAAGPRQPGAVPQRLAGEGQIGRRFTTKTQRTQRKHKEDGGFRACRS